MVSHQIENINETEIPKKNQIEILGWKVYTEMRNSIEGLNSIFEWQNKEFVHQPIEITQSREQKEKSRRRYNASESCVTLSDIATYTSRKFQKDGRMRGRGRKNVWRNNDQSFPNFWKHYFTYTSQWTPSRINSKMSISRHIIVKLVKDRERRRICKHQEKSNLLHSTDPIIRTTAEFSSAIWKSEISGQHIQTAERKTFNQEFYSHWHYPLKKEKRKIITDKQKMRVLITSRPALPEKLKGIIQTKIRGH